MAALMLLSGRLIALLEPANTGTEERLDRRLRRDDMIPDLDVSSPEEEAERSELPTQGVRCLRRE